MNGVIECTCDNENCRKPNISFEEDFLVFKFLERDEEVVLETRRHMYMNHSTVDLLIAELRQFKKTLKK